MNKKTIKPCPFCEEQKQLYVEEFNVVEDLVKFDVFCPNCGACGPQKYSEQQAIDARNKRS